MSQMAGVSPPQGTLAKASRLTGFLRWAMLLSSLGVAFYAARYFILPTQDAHFARYLLALRFHVAGGIGALVVGPWQFSQRLRARAPNVHRWLGRFYLLSVALGSLAGFAMATVSEEGPATHFGFAMLAALWFFTGLQAYRRIRQGDIDAHRRWMTRNFALSLAAVTLRNELPLMLFALHWSFHISYIIISWLCWIPNLLLAEWLIARRIRALPQAT
ncbi:MAG TPA: DUF2306 domain-containing protein [Candidatus Binatia bacterium]|nr:DUF2306 domain-containing protein [Candidatus Binatia bacterium]